MQLIKGKTGEEIYPQTSRSTQTSHSPGHGLLCWAPDETDSVEFPTSLTTLISKDTFTFTIIGTWAEHELGNAQDPEEGLLSGKT